ncbi:MAG: hypothetical protein KF833_01055 [Verrucomicrobiae bacterium]|nr:hypothetical protein [Verrucomicrobiae bacterium]
MRSLVQVYHALDWHCALELFRTDGPPDPLWRLDGTEGRHDFLPGHDVHIVPAPPDYRL